MPNNNIHEHFLQQIIFLKKDLISQLQLVYLDSKYWQDASRLALKLKYRLVALWVQDLNDVFEVNVCLELKASYLCLRTFVSYVKPEIASFTPYFISANRLERHARDMFGINFINHPDNRCWTIHNIFEKDQFPLRKSFKNNSSEPSLGNSDYSFCSVSGEGVYEIPVGPVHAGIIEPGHFRFHVAGEDIINLEERLGYTHKGIEKLAEKYKFDELYKLAGRVSGDSTVAYSWSACKAIESALGLVIPKRALYLRAIMCEQERIANHLGDFAAICNDVAYTFAYYQMTRLKELLLQLNDNIFGNRFMMDLIIVGGVAKDINEEDCGLFFNQIVNFRQELTELYSIFEEHSGLIDRAKSTGILSFEQAVKLGVLGFVGRASGIKFDLRDNFVCEPYDQLKIEIPILNTGDVLARLQIRAKEILISLELIEQLLVTLPPGDIRIFPQSPLTSVEGIGLIEGWRGEILTYVKINNNGFIERYFPRDPSWFSWLALEYLVHGNIVPDFPVCNKSINASYSGVDL